MLLLIIYKKFYFPSFFLADCFLTKDNYFLSNNQHVDLGGPFFPGGPELWHHPLAYSAAAAELPGAAALQHATLVHPALHPQVPVRSYL